jgi:GR25 family glycosyltransferase involved in LPS biosynthesis
MKVYIIALADNIRSTSMAQLTVDSALYSTGYEPTLVQALNGQSGSQFLEANRIRLRAGYPVHEPGAIGCIASHIALWHSCIQMNEPIGIAEHDALFLRDWNNPAYEDILHLNCYGSYVRNYAWPEAASRDRYAPVKENSVFRMGFEPFDFPGSVSMSTTFAYAIKPHAAQRLLNSALTDGYCFADRFIAEPLISIETIHPPIAHEQLTATWSTTREQDNSHHLGR